LCIRGAGAGYTLCIRRGVHVSEPDTHCVGYTLCIEGGLHASEADTHCVSGGGGRGCTLCIRGRGAWMHIVYPRDGRDTQTGAAGRNVYPGAPRGGGECEQCPHPLPRVILLYVRPPNTWRRPAPLPPPSRAPHLPSRVRHRPPRLLRSPVRDGVAPSCLWTALPFCQLKVTTTPFSSSPLLLLLFPLCCRALP
jgi:hypothetical protein